MTASPGTSPIQADSTPTALGRRPISSGVAANRLVLPGNQVINVSVEVVNTCHEDIQYAQGPAARTPAHVSATSLTPSPTTSTGWRVKPGRPPPRLPREVSHGVPTGYAHVDQVLPAIIRPNNGFWEQVVLCEFQLFGKKTWHMVSSLWEWPLASTRKRTV
ncbi:dual specificity protein phosphatase 18-like [Myotis yumanensis]|uniref:dual specificity protein phosphatase 18-like n=1 Tax=Myotis yumanensis TaxID=159337 RepID=UPI0038D3A508